MNPVPCYSCGAALFVDSIPNHSQKLNRSGKFCPCCNAPICETALANTAHEAGNPVDANDPTRKAQRDQAARDVRKMHAFAEEASAKASD